MACRWRRSHAPRTGRGLAIDATDRGLAAEVIRTRYDTRSKTRSTSPEERAILKAPSTYVVSKTPASLAIPGQWQRRDGLGRFADARAIYFDSF